jgi:hypothetical protein
MATFTDLLDMHVGYLSLPPAVARALMNTGMGRALGIAPELIDYFDHAARYDCSNTQAALAGMDVTCPPFESYAPRMIDYMRRHEGTRSEAMY